jgi:RNA polymerase sigma factor (sigma-70 family)
MSTATLTRPISRPVTVPQPAPRQPDRAVTSRTVVPAAPTAELGPAAQGHTEHVRVFEDMYARYYGQVRKAMWRRVSDWAQADDLAQDTFAYLWGRIVSGAIAMDAVEVRLPWIMSWGRGALAQHFNTPARRIETTGGGDLLPDRIDESQPDPADVLAGRAGVAELLAGVPDHVRQSLVLHVLADRPLAEVAERTGLSQAEVAARIEAGVIRVRELLGVTPAQLAARAAATTAERARRHLITQASPPVERTAEFRTDLLAAIAAGTWSPGSVLPTARVLSQTFPARRRQPVDQDTHLIAHVMDKLVRQGIVTGTRDAGYTVTDDGPRLASQHQERVPATAAIARDLLAGIWAPGTRLPSLLALGRRWHTRPCELAAKLDALVSVGALARTTDGHYGIPYGPGEPPQTGDWLTDEQILTRIAATGRVPTNAQLRTTYGLGYERAARLGAAARHAATKQATATRRATNHTKRTATRSTVKARA